MGISVSGIGVAIPGKNGVPGGKYSTYELMQSLSEKIYPFSTFMGRYFPSFQRRINALVDKEARGFEDKTNIKERGLYIPRTDPNPVRTLAMNAAEATISEVAKLKISQGDDFYPEEIDGYVFATSTPDASYPIPGKSELSDLYKKYGIRPKEFDSVVNYACASFAKAFERACFLIKDKDCNKVLIVVADASSRLMQRKHLARNPMQPLLFGDGAAGMVLEGTPNGGGIRVSNFYLDLDAPDIRIKPFYPGDPPETYSDFEDCGYINDQMLRKFAKFEVDTVFKLLLNFWFEHGGHIDENHKLILPQAGNNIAERYFIKLEKLKHKDKIAEAVKKHMIESAVPECAITGSPASLIAWKQGINSGQISYTDKVTIFNCALSGLVCLLTYDPDATQLFDLYDNLILNDSLGEVRSKESRSTTTLNLRGNTIIEKPRAEIGEYQL